MRPALVLSVVALMASPLAVQQRGVPPVAPSGLIVGQVVDAAGGKPIAGVVVSIDGIQGARGRGQAPPPRILTGSDGRFVFRDLPRGSFTINATKTGYVEGATGRRRPGGPSQPVMLGDGERVGEVAVRMWKQGSITGTVVDEAGEPLVSVQVRAYRRAIVGGRRRYAGGVAALTDDRGIYRLGSLVPGDYMVAAIARQVAVPLAMAQELQNRGFPGTVDLGPPPALPGTANATQVGDIVYGLGRGVPIPAPAGARLFVYPSTFYPSVNSFAQATPVSVDAGEERGAIDLQLQPVATTRVAGSVMGPDGPATALTLRLFPSAAADVALEADVPSAITDRNGSFAFPAVTPGQYMLRGSTRPPMTDRSGPPASVFWTELPIAVGRGDIDGLSLALQPGLRVRGRLEFEGSTPPPTGARLQQIPIVVEPADATVMFGLPLQSRGQVDAAGEFVTAGAVPGKYLVRVVGSPTGWMFKNASYKGREVADEPFDLDNADAEGVVITFTDRWTGVRGTVQSLKGAAGGDAIVLVFPTDTESWSSYGLNPRRTRSVRPSAAGDYDLHSLPAGDYYIVAVPDERASDWQDPEFLQALVPLATRLTIRDGDQKVIGLRMRDLR